MKCFNRGCRILLLLLSLILTLQEVYADEAVNATSSDAGSRGQSNSGTSGKTGPGSLIIDKVNNLVKSIENLILFRSKEYDHPQFEKESEGLGSYLYGGKEDEETYLKKSPNKSSGGNRK